MNKAGHWELVARLYRERYGTLEALTVERYTPPPAPVPPLTPDEAWRNLKWLYAVVRTLPPCAACWPRRHFTGRPQRADRSHPYAPARGSL